MAIAITPDLLQPNQAPIRELPFHSPAPSALSFSSQSSKAFDRLSKEHELVAPLIAELLEQARQEPERFVFGVDAGLGVFFLEAFNYRGRVLHCLA